jgi:quercetin dioxygenase-like cupin family protein
MSEGPAHDGVPRTTTPPTPQPVGDLIAYQPGGIVSRQIVKRPAGNVTLFAFDAGQELTEHTSPFDALVHVIDGEAVLSIAGDTARARAGEMLLLPASVPHAVRAVTPFKMLLTMIRA